MWTIYNVILSKIISLVFSLFGKILWQEGRDGKLFTFQKNNTTFEDYNDDKQSRNSYPIWINMLSLASSWPSIH
jgi:hypothetical protein